MLCAGTVENVNKNAFEALRFVSHRPDTHMDEEMHMSVSLCHNIVYIFTLIIFNRF